MNFPHPLTDRYHLASHLARGGMADVYLGTDTLLGRKVAIKILHAQFSNDEAFVKRFRREAQAAANLTHPNIVGIYDWGQANDTYFIVMELVEGRSLRDVLRSDGALLSRRAAEITAEAASALSAAHRGGLVHRDVKPGNILLATDGTVKVTDFGIARAWDDSQELTRTGAVIGTASYFSPEQAQGAPADERSDVYSLGVVLYEMLSGRPPFAGESPVAVAYQHVSASAPPPSAVNADVPHELDVIVTRALEKDPAFRYQTADEMRADLLRVLAGQSPVAPAAVPVPVTTQTGTVVADPTRTRVIQAPPRPTGPATQTIPVLEDRRGSQVPFILTAFALLALLGTMVFLVFRAASGDTPVTTTTTVPLIVLPNFAGMTEQQASAELTRLGLDDQIRPEASSDVESGIVIRTEPGEGVSVPLGSSVFVYVSAGEDPVTVPALIGRTQPEAEQLLTDAGLTLGSVTMRPDAEAEAGMVIEQSPVAGLEIPPGDPVNIVVSEGPEEFELPNLVGMEDGEAFAELNSLDLDWDTIREESSEPEGIVIRTQPEAGALVKAGDVITIVISAGRSTVIVPDLFGMTYDEARRELENAGLGISDNAPIAPTNDPSLDGRVINQSPDAGAEVDEGSTVEVTLGDFQEPPPPTTPTSPPTTIGF